MDRELDNRRDLAPANCGYTMGGELFTVTRKTYYTTPAGKHMLATVDVLQHQPFLPVVP